MGKEVEKFYDALSKEYDKSHSSRFVDKIFEHFILQYLPKNRKLNILDAGGGMGRFSFPLALGEHSVVLTDISQGMIKKAKELSNKLRLGNIEFFRESVTNMKNQQDNSFDVILLMNGVLDYCINYKKALREVFRVLQKSGIVIGTVNNRFVYTTTNILLEEKNPKKFIECFKTGNYYKKFPIHDFIVEELEKELINGGLKIVEILGPTNLLRKWEFENEMSKVDEKKLLSIQIKFAAKKEYLNNSSDFLFIAKKKPRY